MARVHDRMEPRDSASNSAGGQQRDRASTAPLAPRVVRPSGPLEALATDPALPTVAARHGFRTVLRNRYFLRLWVAQVISQTIMNAANYGLIILVTKQVESFTATGGAIVAFSLPALLFAAPAGVLVDRLDRRFVLWMSNVLRAVASVAFVFTVIINPDALWPVYLLAFFIAMIGQFFSPAEGAAIPRLVRKDELIHALSLFNITFTLAQAAGLIVLGPLILLFVPDIHIGMADHGFTLSSVASLYIFIAVLYLVCTALILSIPGYRMKAMPAPVRFPRNKNQAEARRRHEANRRLNLLSGFIECWRFIIHDKVLAVSVAQLALGGSVVAIISMIAPRFVGEFFNQKPELAALVFVPAGAGLILGSALTPRIFERWGYARTIGGGVVGLAACAALITGVRWLAPQLFGDPDFFKAIPYLGVMLLLTFLIGIALDFINVPAQTLMQEHSPDWIKGRVLAMQAMVLNGVTIPFVLIMGWVADSIGLQLSILILALLIAAVGLVSVYFGIQGTQDARTTDADSEVETP